MNPAVASTVTTTAVAQPPAGVVDPKVNLFHAAVVAPALFYAGYRVRETLMGRGELSKLKGVAMGLMITAVIVFLVHSYKVADKVQGGADLGVDKALATMKTMGKSASVVEGACSAKH
jgi:hypothetical protein